MSANFQWVSENLVNKFFNEKALKKMSLNNKFKKGKLFENNVLKYFSKEIQHNNILPSGVIEVFLNTLDYKSHKNEEIDLVFRLGSSFLIVEAKALTFGTDCQDYQNIKKRMVKSDIRRKRQAFIDDFDKFRLLNLPKWNGKFDPKKVHSCYLVSVPQMVGSSINGVPVIDMNILERYFLMGGIDVVKTGDPDYLHSAFYKNIEEAELYLSEYLKSPRQLNIYRKQYDSPITRSQWGYAGKQILVQEGVIKLSKESIERHALSFVESD